MPLGPVTTLSLQAFRTPAKNLGCTSLLFKVLVLTKFFVLMLPTLFDISLERILFRGGVV
jgi:hypothetical protein